MIWPTAISQAENGSLQSAIHSFLLGEKLMRNKYGAQRVGGFGSKLEHAVYCILKKRESEGEIKDIKCQQTVVLQDGDRSEKISWKVDFSFYRQRQEWPHDGTMCWDLCFAEAKGFETEVYKIKLKLFRAKKIGRLELWKGTSSRPFLAEVIE